MDKKIAFSNMLCGGVIMDVMNVEQAKIAEDSGAVAVMALEKVPAMIIREGGIARSSDPSVIQKIQSVVSIPVMAKCRIGHTTEAQILQALNVDCIDESEVLTPADKKNYIDKIKFNVPFVSGCRNLNEALRRISEGSALIRCKGSAGTGNIAEAVTHLKAVKKEIQHLKKLSPSEIKKKSKKINVIESLIVETCEKQKLPVPFFAAGGIAVPADAALCMSLGAESVFVGSGIFMSEEPKKRAKAIVESVNHWRDPKKLAEISTNLGQSM